MTTIKERLAAARLPERSLQVCLRGDLAAEFDGLERQLQETRQGSERRRLNSKSEVTQILEQMDTLREQMAAEMLDVRVRALPRAEWQALIRQHPPAEDNDGDKAMGVNLADFMAEAIPACLVEPELDADDWDRLNEVLCSADYDRLLNAVWDVNRSGVDIPKSRLASLVAEQIAAESKLLPGSE